MKKTKFHSALAMGLSLAMLTACAPASTSGSSEAASETKAEGVKTLEFFWFSDGDEGEAMRKVLDAYEAEHPGIKVELVEVPYADINDKIMMAVSGGEPPALARVTSAMTFREVALDLTDTFGGTEAFFADYPDSVSIDNNICMDGMIYSIPMEASITGLLYNKTAFEQAGVSVPQSTDEVWTWDEFTEKLQTVVENSDVQYGMVLDNTVQRWSNILYQFGGKYLNDDGSPAFTSEETRSALEYTKKMFDDGLWVKSVWLGGEDASNLFTSGQVAVHFAGSWKVVAYHEDIQNFEWGVTYLPYEVQRANIGGYKGVMGFQGSGVEEETKELIKYLASPEAKSYYEDALYISPRLDGKDLNYSFGTEEFATLSEDLAASCTQPAFDMGYPDWYAGVSQTIMDGLCSYIAGNISADELMAEVDAKTAEVLGT